MTEKRNNLRETHDFGTENTEKEEMSEEGIIRISNSKNRMRVLDTIFDPEDIQMKEEILQMIIEYLHQEGNHNSADTIQQEAKLYLSKYQKRSFEITKLKSALLEGDWFEVENLCNNEAFKNEKGFLYAVYRQIYLELIEKQDYQKAYMYITKKLKPLEYKKAYPEEFKDLCYLLSCNSVHSIQAFRNWDGARGKSRENIVEQFSCLFESAQIVIEKPTRDIPSKRLLKLLNQAVSHQIEFNRYRVVNSSKPITVKTLLKDYSPLVIPDSLKHNLIGHTSNVKCISFIGDEGLTLVSGSSDRTLKIWSSETGKVLCTLTGHNSRVWDVCSNTSGTLIGSASADGLVKLWEIKGKNTEFTECVLNIGEHVHNGDVYSVHIHPDTNDIVTAGYDKVIRIYDLYTGILKKTFSGHSSSICKAIFHRNHLVITGSKDKTIKFWDMASGTCVRTLTSLGEVTSLETNSNSNLLLSGSKDNSNRLFDFRAGKMIRRYKGHQNTSKNFIRSGFGTNESLIVGGSEDGFIYIWDLETSNIVKKIHHSPVYRSNSNSNSNSSSGSFVYNAIWNQRQSLLASCGEDSSIKTWFFNSENQL